MSGPTGKFTGGYSLRSIPQPKPSHRPGFWARVAGILTGGLGNPEIYMYEPDPKDPLTYVTSDGLEITPDRFETDLATCPRIGWIVISPWDFAESAIIHDWNYTAKHRGIPIVGFREANNILAEGCRTQGLREWKISIVLWAVNKFGRALWDHDEPAAVSHEAQIGAVVRAVRPR